MNASIIVQIFLEILILRQMPSLFSSVCLGVAFFGQIGIVMYEEDEEELRKAGKEGLEEREVLKPQKL